MRGAVSGNMRDISEDVGGDEMKCEGMYEDAGGGEM